MKQLREQFEIKYNRNDKHRRGPASRPTNLLKAQANRREKGDGVK